MKLQFWLQLQRDILEMKGYCKLYVFILLSVSTIRIFSYYPLLENLLFSVITGVGFVSTTILLAVGKCGRSEKESRILIGYCILLFMATAAALFRIPAI